MYNDISFTVHALVLVIILVMYWLFCRRLAQASSVDDQGQDKDVTFAQSNDTEEVHIYIYST